MTAIQTFKAADDENKGYKRSNDAAFGGWRPQKTKEEVFGKVL